MEGTLTTFLSIEDAYSKSLCLLYKAYKYSQQKEKWKKKPDVISEAEW